MKTQTAISLVERLTELTRARKIRWQPTARKGSYTLEDYSVRLDDADPRLAAASGTALEDRVSLTLRDEEGRVAETIGLSDLGMQSYLMRHLVAAVLEQPSPGDVAATALLERLQKIA